MQILRYRNSGSKQGVAHLTRWGTRARSFLRFGVDGGGPMGYRVYSGPKGSEDIKPMKKAQTLFKQFEALDEALARWRHICQTGRVALLIEGDGGTRMDRRDIGAALSIGEREQIPGGAAFQGGAT